MLSAHTTCRLHNRSLFEYPADALADHARGAPLAAEGSPDHPRRAIEIAATR